MYFKIKALGFNLTYILTSFILLDFLFADMSHQENLTSIHLFIFYSFSLDGGYMEGLSLSQLPLAGRWGTTQTSRHLSDALTDRQSTIHTVIHT